MNRITERISLFLLASFSLLLFACNDSSESAPDNPEWDGRPLDIEFSDLIGYLTKDGDDWIFAVSEPNDFIPYEFWDEDVSFRTRFIVVDPSRDITGFQGKKVVISGRGAYGYIIGGDWDLTWEVLGRIKIDTICLFDDWEAPEPYREPENRVARLVIDTEGGHGINDKTNYVPCTVAMESDVEGWSFDGVTAGIRGRGNSTWLWYPKKPYRIKFDKKHDMLGLDAAKSWVLLANYRDPTDLMNTFVFELGRIMGLQFTNHTRYVTLTLNGEELGLYQLTEQVQVNKARVNIDEDAGYLLSLDRDDGPELAPREPDNFWSDVYRMPVCVKNPEDITSEAKDRVRADFAVLEQAIADLDYQRVAELMDITSFIDYILIQELIYNVEMDAPRSVYIHRDVDSRWTMGPLWDFDAGYDFDWSDMYNGHGYFHDTHELVFGTDPVNHAGTAYRVPGFFSDLFAVPDFVKALQARWTVMQAALPDAWELTEAYVDPDVWAMEDDLWPIGMTYGRQIRAMHNWIFYRAAYLDTVIDAY